MAKGAPQKIDTSVRFPMSINMAPYTTVAMTAGKRDVEAMWVACISNERVTHVCTDILARMRCTSTIFSRW